MVSVLVLPYQLFPPCYQHYQCTANPPPLHTAPHHNSGATSRDELFYSLFISVLFISQYVIPVGTRLSICVPKDSASAPATGDNHSTTNFLHIITVRADCFMTNLCAKYTRFLADSQSQRYTTTAPVRRFWDFQNGAAEGSITRGHAGTSLSKQFLTFRQKIVTAYSKE